MDSAHLPKERRCAECNGITRNTYVRAPFPDRGPLCDECAEPSDDSKNG